VLIVTPLAALLKAIITGLVLSTFFGLRMECAGAKNLLITLSRSLHLWPQNGIPIWGNHYYQPSVDTNIVEGIFIQIFYLTASINFEVTRIAGMNSSILDTSSNRMLSVWTSRFFPDKY
jgi:hypothetical protein